MSIFKILQSISDTPSKNNKIAILEENKQNELLKDVFKRTYNGLVTYNIKKITQPSIHTGTLKLEDAIKQLDMLSDRKVTGHAASAFVTELLSKCTPCDASVLTRVIMRDLRIGASESSANKVWPNLIPTFRVMLATSYSDKALSKIKYPAYAQLKADGSRTQAIVDLTKKTVSFWTRNGKLVHLSQTKVSETLDIFPSTMSGKWVIDGEIVYKPNNADETNLLSVDSDDLTTNDGVADRSTGNGIYNKAIKDTIEPSEESCLHFSLWDIIEYDQWEMGKSTVTYVDRLNLLKTLNHNNFTSVIDTDVVNNLTDAKAVYARYINAGFEGIILKNTNSLWSDSRSADQVKFKQVMTADLKLIRVNQGTVGKKYEHTASTLTCRTSCGLVEVDVAGLSEDDREVFWALRDSIAASNPIIEVEYNGIVRRKGSSTYSLFLPRYKLIRRDKDVANSLDDLQDQQIKVSL